MISNGENNGIFSVSGSYWRSQGLGDYDAPTKKDGHVIFPHVPVCFPEFFPVFS